jgi:hypothetical protein
MSPRASTTSTRRSAAWLAVWLLAGLGLRLALAWAERGSAREWEAEGFVRAWEGWRFGDLNLMRPVGFTALLGLIGRLVGAGDVLALRLACIGLSLVSLASGFCLVAVVLRSTRLAQYSAWTGCAWLTAIWALSPTLVEVGVRPLPELVLGSALCLLLAAAAAWGQRPGLLRWVLLAAALAAVLLLGGLIVGLALLAAVLVYLAPVPRLPVALAVVLAVLAAGSCAWLAQTGPGAARRWSPDAAPAWGFAALTNTRFALDDSLPIDPQRREAFVLAQALREAREQGALRVASEFGRRLVVEQIGPARLEHLDRPALPASLLDAFLRGGALLFAVATLALLRRGDEASLPRAAIVTGVLVLGLLAVAGATSPFALGPFDLLIAALGAVGVAGSQREGARTRWLGFGVGGAMMAALVVTAALTHQEPSDWSRQLRHESQQGERLVALLGDGGPQDASGHMQAVLLLADPAAPFQRLPEAARRHAEAGVALAPDDPQVLLALVQAELENLDFERARALVSSLVDDAGALTPQARIVLLGIADRERRLRAERLP